MQHISKVLNEDSLRSFEKTVAAAQRDSSLFDAVVSGLSNADPLIRRRAAYAVEKMCRKRPAYLYPYKDLLIEHAISDRPEVRFSLIRLLPRLPLDDQERVALFEKLRMVLFDASDMLKVVALEVLVTLAENDTALSSQMIALLEEQAVTGIPANQNLAKYHLPRLITPGAMTDGQWHKRLSFRERWQRSSQMWVFGNQFMKVAMPHYRSLRNQEQERERQSLSTKKKLLKELSNLFYGAAALAFFVVFAHLEIEVFSVALGPVSLIDYITGALWLATGPFGIWLLGFGVKNLVEMGLLLHTLKRASKPER